MNNVLIIGYIWPRPDHTAAGYRLLQIMELMQEMGYQLHFTSAAGRIESTTQLLEDSGVQLHDCAINDDGFDHLLQALSPLIVIYDRFLIEELYGWRVRKILPNALQILDTEDLHFLRKAREEATEKDIPLEQGLRGELAMREVSSILRVDLSLIISSYEMQLLIDKYDVPHGRLCYLPFFIENNDLKRREQQAIPYSARLDFCTIGNLRHQPNIDAVIQLQQFIWPAIRKKIPDAQLHIYGANAPARILGINDPQGGFLIKGHTPSVDKALQRHLLMLAPLRYGAGLKGKIFDAMKNGLPVVMTPMAAEGFFDTIKVPGMICNSNSQFIDESIKLYKDSLRWRQYQKKGYEVLSSNFEKHAFAKALHVSINTALKSQNVPTTWMQRMLTYHADAQFKYRSYWINSKLSKN
jgi:glycosyltransferase involved in cell wall biosynthesis